MTMLTGYHNRTQEEPKEQLVQNILPDPKIFILAGKAVFTILHINTGNRYTFKVIKRKDANIWFVWLMNGPSNEGSFGYMGTIFDAKRFQLTKKSKYSLASTPYKAFSWLWNMLYSNRPLPDSVKIFHEGACGCCGRRLTVPESIKAGIGPVCAKNLINYW